MKTHTFSLKCGMVVGENSELRLEAFGNSRRFIGCMVKKNGNGNQHYIVYMKPKSTYLSLTSLLTLNCIGMSFTLSCQRSLCDRANI